MSRPVSSRVSAQWRLMCLLWSTACTCTAGGQRRICLPTGVRLLAADVLALEEGLPPETLDTGGAAWPYERRRQWRSLLETTTYPADVRCCASRTCLISPVAP